MTPRKLQKLLGPEAYKRISKRTTVLVFSTAHGWLGIMVGFVVATVAAIVLRPFLPGLVRVLDIPPNLSPMVMGGIAGGLGTLILFLVAFAFFLPLQHQALIENGFCPYCAARLASKTAITCTKCGKAISRTT